MSEMTNKVFDDALSLPADQRMNLVDALLRSLNLPLAEDVEREWLEIAERRADQIERGEDVCMPVDEFLDALYQRYQR